jgi:hypothetical protein
VSEYLDTLGLIKSYFFKFFEKKNRKKIGEKMSRWSDAPEDQAICLFAGLLANLDVPLSPSRKLFSTGHDTVSNARRYWWHQGTFYCVEVHLCHLVNVLVLDN